MTYKIYLMLNINQSFSLLFSVTKTQEKAFMLK